MPSPQIFLVLIHLITLVHAFGFSVSNPSQCDGLTVTWSGGQAPFRLLILPPGGTVQNISIPATAYQGPQASFSTTLDLPQNQLVMFSMSDATGITSGGVSALMTVGPSVTGTTCNTTDPGVDFFFSLDSPLLQCKPYPFTQFTGAIQPITVVVLVPLGQSFVLQAPIGDTFIWPAANLTANTQVAFLVYDALGRKGGTSGLHVVQDSGDASCISASAVTSSSIPVGTSTTKGGQTSSTVDKSPSHSSSHVAIIAGAVAGGVALLILIILLVFCCRRKKSQQSGHNPHQKMDLTYEPAGAPAPEGASYLLPGHYTSTALVPDHNHSVHTQQNVPPSLVTPYMNQTGPSAPQQHDYYPTLPSAPQQFDHYTTHPTVPQPYGHQATSSVSGYNHSQNYQPQGQYEAQNLSFSSSAYAQPRQGSLASTPQHQNEARPISTEQSVMSGYTNRLSTSDRQSAVPVHGSSNVIMHTDIEETMEPVELPPQYSENRAPIPGLANSEAGGSSSGTTSSWRDSRNKGKKP